MMARVLPPPTAPFLIPIQRLRHFFFSASQNVHFGRNRLPGKFSVAAQPRDRDSSTGSSNTSSKISPENEYSETVNEELLFFLFQLDLASRLQRAMNQDQFETAKMFREKISEVEKEVERRREKDGAVSAKNEAQDKELALLRLRSELAKAVESEDYEGAANLRDKISKLEAESLAASLKALAYQNVKYSFRLGQKVKHKKFGYRGVVCGMDPVCCEFELWTETAKVNELPKGRNQPFYQVLVDVESQPQLLTAYVAEESLEAPAEPDKEALEHPYIYFLFFGMDTAGDYIPTKQLREKYDAPRHEQPEAPEE